jgi:hypothetical protein
MHVIGGPHELAVFASMQSDVALATFGLKLVLALAQ